MIHSLMHLKSILINTLRSVNLLMTCKTFISNHDLTILYQFILFLSFFSILWNINILHPSINIFIDISPCPWSEVLSTAALHPWNEYWGMFFIQNILVNTIPILTNFQGCTGKFKARVCCPSWSPTWNFIHPILELEIISQALLTNQAENLIWVLPLSIYSINIAIPILPISLLYWFSWNRMY